MEIKASARYLRISPRKLRLVAQPLRGRGVEEALALLKFLPQKGARLLKKVVDAAVANAEQRAQIDLDKLVIASIWVDGGPVLKRLMPRAMGRANRILKRTSHLTVVLGEAAGKKKKG